MCSVFDAAQFVIDALKVDGEPTVTNMQLNKLLYFAQGHYLARTGKPLFDSPFEAWRWGPVVPEVYRAYHPFKNIPIILPAHEDCNCFGGIEFETLIDVLAEYGKYSTHYLVELSHEAGGPWAKTPQNEEIAPELMAEYFTAPERRLETIGEWAKRQYAVSVLPKDWYDPEEDVEWEQYR